MKKNKIILFGASKFIYETAIDVLNFDNCELVALVDNDIQKIGFRYEFLQVITPTDLSTIIFDYILIGAWYSYESVALQLIELGVSKEHIIPLLHTKHMNNMICENASIDLNICKRIYRKGDNLYRQLKEVNRVNNLFKKLSPIENTKLDWKKYPLIAHACGGYINKKKYEYTNSLEALKESFSNGFKMIECDIWGIEDDIILLGSRLKMQWPKEIDYTVCTLDMIFEIIKDDSEKKVILDIKWNTVDDFYRILDKIEFLVQSYLDKGYFDLKKQIMIETFEEKTSEYATKREWDCILTDYRAKDGQWIRKSAVICGAFGINKVLLDADYAFQAFKYLPFLTEKNIDIVCYTIDYIENYSELKKIGITSVLTNFLLPVQKII